MFSLCDTPLFRYETLFFPRHGWTFVLGRLTRGSPAIFFFFAVLVVENRSTSAPRHPVRPPGSLQQEDGRIRSGHDGLDMIP